MIPKLGPVIAIDGPAGTGKSTATKRLAEILAFTHVDTGALYRAVAYTLSKTSRMEDLKEADAVRVATSVTLEFKRDEKLNPKTRVLAGGEDVTPFIRTPEMSLYASRVSAFPGVRAALLGMQRRLGSVGKTILEGRDIGTVIFPDADVKFFLTASVEERAKRRLAELEVSGADAISFEEVKKQIRDRDEADSTRAVAPLKRADDAIEIDTSNLTLDQVVFLLEKTARNRLKL